MAVTNSSAVDIEVDILVIGSGTGMAAALSAHEQGLKVLVVEKTEYVGGSTALSGGGVWVPANPVLTGAGSTDTVEQGLTYTESVVAGSAPKPRWTSAIEHGPAAIAMLQRTTPLNLMWQRGYSYYHPANHGGLAIGRTIGSRPFAAAVIGAQRRCLRATGLCAPVPLRTTSVDYKQMNLFARMRAKGVPKIARRVLQG